ncbi:MAG: ACT domain-containing protein [Planctomycetes bacterium]|nr:ACT domain-containing protein [Planctomycetota bacterium]
MKHRQLKLSLLKDKYGICTLSNTDQIPEWALKASLVSITRTKKELTIVCPQDVIPSQCKCDLNWRCFRVDGSFDLNQIGVISSISEPLAEAEISIYVISTYVTDYFLVQSEKIEQTISILSGCGHSITK